MKVKKTMNLFSAKVNKKLITLSVLLTLLVSPLIAFALPGQVLNIPGVMLSIISFIWPLFVGFAIIMFLVAGFLFLTASGDPGKVKSAKDALIWGIVGVIVGILAFSLPFIIGMILGTGI